METKNYFYTRMKFGRWRFDIILIIGFSIQFFIGLVEGSITGFPSFLPFEVMLANNIFALIGAVSLIFFTELVSQLNCYLINELGENNIFLAKTQFEDKAKTLIWSNKVYVLAGLWYLVGVIGHFSLTFSNYYEGKVFFSGLINQTILGWLAPILYAELIWVTLVPILLIFSMPFNKDIPITLNVFASDKAGGLSPIADYLLKISLLITLTESLALYWMSTPSTPLWAALLILLIIILLPLLYFTIPTIGLNRVMHSQKKAVVKELDQKMKVAYELFSPLQSHEVTGSHQYYLESLRLLQESAFAMHEWPFSFSGLRNLLGSFLIPIGIFLFNNFERILELF